MLSPTARTLHKLTTDGYRAHVVEKWMPKNNRRVDMFGCIDVVGIGGGQTIAVQTTTYSNVSSRVKKIRASEALPDMIEAGWIVVVHGWHKKAGRWVCREVYIE